MSEKDVREKNDANALSVGVHKASIVEPQFVALRRWLAEQLVAHEYAKLGQGGHTQNQVPLRRVFVDLPVTDSQNSAPRSYGRVRFLANLLAAEPMNLHSVLKRHGTGLVAGEVDVDDNEREEYSSRGADWRRYEVGFAASLLVGGPGQGKSTLGQLACQLHRAALLRSFEQELTTAQRELIKSFEIAKESNSRGRDITLPLKPLLPLQISLPDFAGWYAKFGAGLEKSNIPAILQFVAELPSAKNVQLTKETLVALCSKMPCLLVLDGFDEVGAAQDREQLVKSARELISFFAVNEVSAQIVATTRPQGYTGEFSKLGIPLSVWYLAPLLKSEALTYAEKLVTAKIPDPDVRKKTLERIHEAAAEPSTRRLLTTPLQVTILSALVQQIGRAPRERWNLFSRYFSYTYDREIERETYASRLLAEHRNHIEQIHARVALLLQVEAERDGGAAARMPQERLEEVIEAVLVEDEVDPEERKHLVKEISVAAGQRLVFLVEPEPGAFGFEIRSLQEFMAAWAITSGRDSEVESRLLPVAKASMFRNVVLFAASRLYSEASPLRDALADGLCSQLDMDVADGLQRVILAGSMLALEILEEGAVLSQPKRARSLMKRAASLLTLPANEAHERLTRVANSDTAPVLLDAIDTHLSAHSDSEPAVMLGAWTCLLAAVDLELDGAEAVAQRHFITLQRIIVHKECGRLRVEPGSWMIAKMRDHSIEYPPRLFLDEQMFVREKRAFPKWATWFADVYSGTRWQKKRGRASVVRLQPATKRSLLQRPSKHEIPESWMPWIRAAEFEVNPSSETLADALVAIAEDVPVDAWDELEWRSSWPMAACLAAAENPSQLRKFAQALRDGELGTLQDWMHAQASWGTGINLPTLLQDASDDWPWKAESLDQGAPLYAIPLWILIARRIGKNLRERAEALHLADELFSIRKSNKLRFRLGFTCAAILANSAKSLGLSNCSPRKWVSEFPSIISQLIPRPKGMSRSNWTSLLEETPYDSSFESWSAPTHGILESLLESGFHPVVVRHAVLYLETLERRYLTPPTVTEDIQKTIASALKKAIGTTALQRADLAIVRLWLLSEEEGDVTISTIFGVGDKASQLWPALLIALRLSRVPEIRTSELAAKIYRKMGPTHVRVEEALRHLQDIFQLKKSGLGDEATWDRLGFPLPYPKFDFVNSSIGMLPQAPVLLGAIELREVRGLQHLVLPLSEADDTKGQWTVVIGPNGTGKTTLLRGLALALRNVNDPSIWPNGTFGSSWLRASTQITDSITEARICVTVKGEGEQVTTIRSGASLTINQTPSFQRQRLFPIFAYGCRRGSALGGMAREVDLGVDDGPEIATLFDDRADLIHAETWLIQLDGDAPKSERSKHVYDVVTTAIRKFLNLEELVVLDKKVWVKEPCRPRLPFSSLSDGYLTSAGWFLDLLARWVALVEKTQELEGDFLSKARGLVLIDEIDLHLHPKWQIEIISRTRSILPQMSFVVTTHSPLTLVGARAEEIWILADDGSRILAKCGVEAPLSLTGGQLYGRYFGVRDIYPTDLGRAIQRHGFLSSFAARSESEEQELALLAEKLSSAGVLPEWDIVERHEIDISTLRLADVKEE